MSTPNTPSDDGSDELADDPITEEEIDAAQQGKRRRTKLLGLLDGESRLDGQDVGYMSVGTPAALLHHVLLEGPGLTNRGGPAHVVLDLVNSVIGALVSAAPAAEPWLHSLLPTMSMEVTLEPSEREVIEAAARVRVRHSSGYEALTDTALGLSVVTRVLTSPDPDRAAAKTVGLGVQTYESVYRLADKLVKNNIEAVTFDRALSVQRAPIERLREELERDIKLPNETVEVAGVLRGLNAVNHRFVLVTDDQLTLPEILKYRRSPGAKLTGILPESVQGTIERKNLWNKYVIADIEVVRTQRGVGKPTIKEMRLVGIRPRFAEQS